MDTTTQTRVPSPDEMVQAPTGNLPSVHQNGAFHSATDEGRMDAPAPALINGCPKLTAAIAAVMSEVQAIAKGGTNSFHRYQYARMQDILQTLTPLIGKHGLVIFQTERERSVFDGGNVIAIQYQFTITHSSGEVWPERPLQTGMSRCRDSKSGFDDKALAKCHTAARKYFLLALFQVPTADETDDSDRASRNRQAPPVPSPSGHVPPYQIEPVSRETAKSWAAKYMAAIKSAKSAEEIAEWESLNDALLDNLNEKSLDIYADVQRVTNARMNDLRAIDETPTRPPPTPPKTTKPAKAKTSPPPPLENPEAYIDWAKSLLQTATSAEELDQIFNNQIEPSGFNGQFPPDQEEILGEHKRLRAKFEP